MNQFDTKGRLLFYCEGVDDPTKDHDAYISAEDAGQHNLIGSLCKNGMHKPALDLDFAATRKDSCVQMWLNKKLKQDDTNNLAKILLTLDLIEHTGHVSWVDTLNCLFINFSVPADLIQSSTIGHFHLYLDKELTYAVYKTLIETFVDVGILQQGILRRFNTSGQTFLRPPGHIKPSNCIGSGGEEEPEEVRADYRIVYYDADPYKSDKIAVAAYVEYTDEKGKPVGDATLHANVGKIGKDRLGGDEGLFLLNTVLGSNYFQLWEDLNKLHESCGPHFSLGVKDWCEGTSDIACADKIMYLMNNKNEWSKYS